MGRPGIQVQRAHGMADSLILLPHGLVPLGIFRPKAVHALEVLLSPAAFALLLIIQGLRAPGIDKELREVQIALFTGCSIQAAQRQLDLRMAGIAGQLALFRAKHTVDMVSHAGHDIQERALSGGFIIGHRALDQVPCRVQLMALLQVLPTMFWLLDCKICI